MTDETPDAPGPDDGLPEHVRALLAAPVAPEGVLDRARNAALDAFDEIHAASDDEAAVAPVRELGSAGSARRAWYQRVPLSAAAAIVAVVALVGVFSQVDLSSSDGDDMATAELDADDSGDAAGGSTFESGDSVEESADDGFSLAPEADEGTAGGDGGTTPASEAMRAVYVYPDVDALVDDYRRRFTDEPADQSGGTDSTAPPETTSTDAALHDTSACDAVDAAGVDPDLVVAVDPVQLGPDDQPSTAFAVVYESEATGVRVAVVDGASCEPLADRAL